MAKLSDQSWQRPTTCKSFPLVSAERRNVASIVFRSPALKRRIRKKYATCSRALEYSSFQYTSHQRNYQNKTSLKYKDQVRSQNENISSVISCINVRMIWKLITIICTCVCLGQSAERIKYYLDEPVMSEVNVIRQDKVEFPVITFCPTKEPFDNSSLGEKITSWQHGDFSVEEAWEQHRLIVNESIFIDASCNEDNSICNVDGGVPSNLTTLKIHNYFGSCLTVLPGPPMEYRGSSSFMVFTLLPGKHNAHILGKETVAQFFFQESDSIHRHEAYFLTEWLRLYEEHIVRLSLKQFNFLNTSRNLCDDEATVTDCRNRCADKALDQNINCSLPFMVSKWPACKTLEDGLQAQQQSSVFYEKFTYSLCPCRRQCTEKVYSYNYNSNGQYTENKTTLMIMFSENMVQNVTEVYAYSFSALISDLGGGLGFFLGFSVLNLFNELEKALASYRFKKKVK